MKLVHSRRDLQEELLGGPRPVFVPTMGNLHAGHISLARQARNMGGTVVVSIFVNPLQFGAGEDFESYPRTLDADCSALAGIADVVFAPPVGEMYPEPQEVTVQPPAIARELCGAHRPGHFQGVATVVLKLLHMVEPRAAIFGKKDYQQLFIIQTMVRQLNLDIEILGGDIVRAEDGLALSSRNGYLTPDERKEAPRLNQTLREAGAAVAAGARDWARLEREAEAMLTAHNWEVDYFSIRCAKTLSPTGGNEKQLVILAAARLGRTRLIDNIEVDRR